MNDNTDTGEKQVNGQSKSDDTSIFDRVMPDGVKRGLESLLREGRLKNLFNDIKIPREIAVHIMSQVDDTKKAAVQVISREIRQFLENTNLADELARLLTQISFQVKTEISFVPKEKTISKKDLGSANIKKAAKKRRKGASEDSSR
jgi:regulator of replication initiation timing